MEFVFYSLKLHQFSCLPIAVSASRFHLERVDDAFMVEHVPAIRHSTHIISRDDIVVANRAALNLNWWSKIRVLSFLYLRFRLLILLWGIFLTSVSDKGSIESRGRSISFSRFYKKFYCSFLIASSSWSYSSYSLRTTLTWGNFFN